MKISPTHLASHLKERFAGLYIVHGDELLLLQEAADQIRIAARDAGYRDRQVFDIERGFDWMQVQEASCAMSLFGDRRFIELRFPSAKPGVAGAAALEALAQSIDEHTAFFIQLPRVDATTQKSAWFTALERVGVSIQIDKVSYPQLAGWIRQRLQQQGQYVEKNTAGQQALQFIVDCVEGNLLAAYQEIQKLGLLYPSGELTAKQLKEAVLDVARYDVFQLSEAFLAADIRRLTTLLEGLREEDISPVLVLWVLTEDIRAMLRIQKSIQAGCPLAQALRENRVWGARAQLMGSALKQYSTEALQASLSLAAQLDRQIKGIPFLRMMPTIASTPPSHFAASCDTGRNTGRNTGHDTGHNTTCNTKRPPFSTAPYAGLPVPGIWEGLFQLAAGLCHLFRR